MSKPKIPGGYIMLPRAKHPIDEMPSLYRDVWIYILKKASHKDDVSKGYKRGECLISIPEIQEALTYYVGFKKVTPTKHQIDNIIRWLRKTNTYDALYDNGYDVNTTMITTTRTTRGMVVKVHGYAFLQDSKNYEYDSTNDNENGTYTKRVRQQPDTIYKNVKELKNDNNVVVVPEQKNDFAEVIGLYQSDIQATPPLTVINKLSDDFDLFGKDIMLYAIKKSALAGNRDYRFIDYLTKDWRKQQLKTLEAVEQYEDKRNQPKRSYNNQQNTKKVEEYTFVEIDEKNLPF